MARKRLDKVDSQMRLLPFPLSSDELKIKGEQVLNLLAEIESAEDKKAAAAVESKARLAEYDSKLAGYKKDLKTLRGQIVASSDLREVQCDVYANAADGVMEIHRTDVSERHPSRVVSVIPMNLMEVAEANQRNAEADTALSDEGRAIADAEASAESAAAEAKAKKASKKAATAPKAEKQTTASPKTETRTTRSRKGNGAAYSDGEIDTENAPLVSSSQDEGSFVN